MESSTAPDGATTTGQRSYIYDNAWTRARERLAAVEAGRDPATIQNLEGLGVREGWRCLEVGAGGGTIADWLCERVGSSGHVVAIDIDTRFVEQIDRPNLEVRRQDIAQVGAAEADMFDLVHARMVLEHVPARDEALRNMVVALKPGGWILLEELDHVTMLPDPSVDAHTQIVWSRFMEAYGRLMQRRGGDLDYGRRLFGQLTAHGLANVSAQGHVKVGRGGGAGALGFHQARIDLVATGALDDDDMGTVLALFDDPGFAYISPLMMVASGQRPLA
jgi:hypothetical protein